MGRRAADEGARSRHARHRPVSPGAVPRFLQRFAAVYGSLGKADAVLASAAAHHRLLWIHPFLDGNGRVARLMSHAPLGDALDTGGTWSIARGLAREMTTYKARLAACDQSRQGDLDGRGNLSEATLADFTRFFLDVCIDQVKFNPLSRMFADSWRILFAPPRARECVSRASCHHESLREEVQ